jgi:acetylglutamate kinase
MTAMAVSPSKTAEAEGDSISSHLIAKVLPSIEYLRGRTLVIKLGGSTLEHQRGVLQDIIWLHSLGARPVLVHGGGSYINAWLEKLNVPTRFENGLRVTDAFTLEIVRMVLLGQVNSGLVLLATQMGGRAIGLSGTDGHMIQAKIAHERLGYVGEIVAVDTSLVQMLLDQGYTPVIAPLGQGPDGECLNINADLVAARLAGALQAEKLIFLSDVVGICRQDGSLISELTETEAKQLIAQSVVSGGMIPKVQACLQALTAVARVHIVDGGEPHVLLRELFTDQGAGTIFVKDSR